MEHGKDYYSYIQIKQTKKKENDRKLQIKSPKERNNPRLIGTDLSGVVSSHLRNRSIPIGLIENMGVGILLLSPSLFFPHSIV